jgi:hypothetical protein
MEENLFQSQIEARVVAGVFDVFHGWSLHLSQKPLRKQAKPVSCPSFILYFAGGPALPDSGSRNTEVAVHSCGLCRTMI